MNIRDSITLSKLQVFNQLIKSSFLNLFLLALISFYAQSLFAETNVSGVEIEIVSEQVDSDLVGDPVQDYLTDVEPSEIVQTSENEDLWIRIKDGYAMPDVQSSFATHHENVYTSRPDYLKRMLDRSQKYLFHIVEEVEKRGMPSEIALLPMIESAFNPRAFSTSAASGIWQFIPSTGKSFGLQQNWWVDNRRDVTAATSAALTYLQKLHGMFGAWDLALAAYNAGEGTVQRAIIKNRNQGLPTNYENLSLPAETRNYVPKLQAIKNIITNPERFGLKLGSIPNKPYFARVTTPKQIDAKLAAQFAEISLEEFSALNPSYNRPVITSQNEKHQLLLPVWAADRFVENLASYDKPLTNWQTYNAKRGERMDNIAQKFGINVNQLRHVNGLSSAKQLRNAQAVLVPANYTESDQVSSINTAEMENYNTNAIEDNEDNEDKNDTIINEPKHSSPVMYKVKRGDTLHGLASNHDISPKELMRLNHLKTNKVFVGQFIRFNQMSSIRKSGNNKSGQSFQNEKLEKKSNLKTNEARNGKIKNGKINSRIVQIKSKNLKSARSKNKIKTKQI